MDRCVLDTSVIVKSIFKPLKSLSDELYKREMGTHEKCRLIIKRIEEKGTEIYIPKVCVVETAAVVKRLADQKSAKKISKGVFESYDVVEEALLFDSAWEVATNTGCSGFDSYFIALARIRNAVLLTDDGGQHFHAEEIGVGSVLIREANIKQIEDIIS